MPKQRRRRKYSPPFGSVNHFPTEPGWWVQWSGRTDWQRETDTSGPLLKQVLAGEGDKVVQILPRQRGGAGEGT